MISMCDSHTNAHPDDSTFRYTIRQDVQYKYYHESFFITIDQSHTLYARCIVACPQSGASPVLAHRQRDEHIFSPIASSIQKMLRQILIQLHGVTNNVASSGSKREQVCSGALHLIPLLAVRRYGRSSHSTSASVWSTVP